MKRKRDYKTINACRLPFCELCGGPADIEPHHIFTRGAGGRDIQENLIQLCTRCHIMFHNGDIPRDVLLGIVADREHHTVDYIYAFNRRAMGYNVELPEE